MLKEKVDKLNLVLKYVKDNLENTVNTVVDEIVNSYRNNGKVILMGNGGSAADAQHIAAEFVGRFKIERPALPSLALNTNTSTLTAVGNDYSYDDIFSRQIEAFANKGDIVVGISTSGNSLNVIKAIEKAKAKGAKTVGFLGKDGGKLKDIVDIPLIIKCDETARVQECHIFIAHIICDMVEQKLYPNN